MAAPAVFPGSTLLVNLVNEKRVGSFFIGHLEKLRKISAP